MGLQSSRIIWGKNKLPGTNNKTPVDEYNSSDVVYVSGNYTIYSRSRGVVAEDYHLYLCTATETGGDFNSDDWKEQVGVKNWDLQAYRVYKVNARVIKELHDEEYSYVDDEGQIQTIILDGIYLFKCIQNTPMDHAWHQECWELVFQEVGLGYIVRDHKEVYYDDGRNKNKWHRMMFFIPPEYDEKVESEILLYDEEQQYHYDDKVLHEHPVNGLRCYKFNKAIPYKGEWSDNYWDEINDINVYTANIAYNKNDQVFKLSVDIYECYVVPFQSTLRYNIGKACIYPIDPSELDRGVSFPQEYREKILGGESVYGLYISNSTVDGEREFDRNKWDLLVNQEFSIGGIIYNSDRHYIEEYQYTHSYVVGQPAIWNYEDSDTFALNICIKDILVAGTQNDPRNKEYWMTPTEVIETKDQYRVYKALRDIAAADNTHWQRDNWAAVTQQLDYDYGLYGVIWEKLGSLNGAGMPFYIPLAMSSTWTVYHNYITSIDVAIDSFYQYVGNNILELGSDNFHGLIEHNEIENLSVSNGKAIGALITNGLFIYATQLWAFVAQPFAYATGIVVGIFGKFYYLETKNYDERRHISPTTSGFLFEEYGTSKIFKALVSADGTTLIGYTEVLTLTNVDYSTLNAGDVVQGIVIAENTWRSHINGATKITTAKAFVRTDIHYTEQDLNHDTVTILLYDGYLFDNGNAYETKIRGSGTDVYNRIMIDSIDATYMPNNQNVIIYSIRMNRSEASIYDDTGEFPGKDLVLAEMNAYGYSYQVVDTGEYYYPKRIDVRGSYFSSFDGGIASKREFSSKSGDTIYNLEIRQYMDHSSTPTIYSIVVVLTVINKYSGVTHYVIDEVLNATSNRIPSITLIWVTDDQVTFLVGDSADNTNDDIRPVEGRYVVNLTDGSLVSKIAYDANQSYYNNGATIPYYNNETCRIYINGRTYYISKAKIMFTHNIGNLENNEIHFINYDSETGEITLMINMEHFYRQPYCGNATGSPSGRPNGLYISGWGKLRNSYSASGGSYFGTIGLCIPSITTNNTYFGAFFWFDADENIYGPFYGSTVNDGFMGW